MTSQKLFAAFVSGCLFMPAVQMFWNGGLAWDADLFIKFLMYLIAAIVVGLMPVNPRSNEHGLL